MEFGLSGNALKTFARAITCLARVGSELSFQASSSQIAFLTLNASRSAYQSVTLKPDLFDVYKVPGTEVKCSVLLKAICAVLRTPITNIDTLSVHLLDPDASKVQWTLLCLNGMKKSYWITCNVDPDIHLLALDRRKFQSDLVVRPRDLNRLLANFQSSLQEITIIATDPNSVPSDSANDIGGKAVELRSYVDPTKDNDSSLHTQLWIDPAEEFLHYFHSRDPVDVTFAVKELKAFVSFCEACEVDIHLYLDKAGEPILMAPKFGFEDGCSSNFDAALVLATMLQSQLHGGHTSEPLSGARVQSGLGRGGQQHGSGTGNVSERPSDHTKIWSELSGSGAKSGSGTEGRQAQEEENVNANQLREVQKISRMHIWKADSVAGHGHASPTLLHSSEADFPRTNGNANNNGRAVSQSQHHPSNWVEADDDDDDDDEDNGDDNELCVQSTPPYYEEQ
uniref:Cell cycle checkpoint control protein RAD9A n=1 Tax=Kalanchoe fedtschenkoi TaxID=63787 RepID=A0A7N0TG73_KALFE